MKFVNISLILLLLFLFPSGGASSGNEKLNGEVRINGSSTVFPIMAAVSEEFRYRYPLVKAPVGISGTGGGFEKFLKGEIDISSASRPINEEEKKVAAKAGIRYTEFQIAYDGLTIIVNKDNNFIDFLTLEELRKIFSESSFIKTWSDIRKGWPKKKIEVYSPGADSGTYQYFEKTVLQNHPIRHDVQFSEDDNVLVHGVAASNYAIGYFGYAYYSTNQNRLKAIPVDSGSGPVSPNAKSIKSGQYSPLSRPLYIYVNNKAIKERKAVYSYVKFAITYGGKLASSKEIGYVPLPKRQYECQLKKLKMLKRL